ncbi:MAG TPA: DUF4920 domain-containing protein [Thermoanaerobaculia bacterium]|nr:DUF4920 domain-containing protein [Thermoanaerobaculia bacterium]
MKTFPAAIAVALVALGALGGEEVVRRGAPISSHATAVPLAKLLDGPEAYAKTPVLVEGVIETACTNKGCWMQLVPAAGEPGMRVTFKDYGFFVPLDSKGMQARAEGVTRVRTLSKKEADHLEGEGAKLTRNADGTAREVSFVATGVELRK